MPEQKIIIVRKPDWKSMTDEQKAILVSACYDAYVRYIKSKGV